MRRINAALHSFVQVWKIPYDSSRRSWQEHKLIQVLRNQLNICLLQLTSGNIIFWITITIQVVETHLYELRTSSSSSSPCKGDMRSAASAPSRKKRRRHASRVGRRISFRRHRALAWRWTASRKDSRRSRAISQMRSTHSCRPASRLWGSGGTEVGACRLWENRTDRVFRDRKSALFRIWEVQKQTFNHVLLKGRLMIKF